MLFQLNKKSKSTITPVKPITLSEQGFTEKDLENLISNSITELIPENQLMVFSQQRPFQEEADIFALDKDLSVCISLSPASHPSALKRLRVCQRMATVP